MEQPNTTTPPAEGAEQAINFQCPNCAGPLTFGIESQRWECKFCNSSFEKQQMQENGSAVSGGEAFTPPQTDAFGDDELVSYTCPSCGGVVMADRNTTATFCAYCHNPTVLAGRLQGAQRPQYILPFKQTKQQIVEQLKGICKSKPLLPRAFKDAVDKGEVTGLYVPYWLFSAQYNVMATGRATTVRTWRDPNFIYTKTDTYHVERGARISFERVPADGSLRMDDEVMSAIEPFDYAELVPFSMQYLSGHVAEGYDVAAAECHSRFAQRTAATTQAEMNRMATGYTTANLRCSTSVAQSRCEYALLPVWTITVPNGDKTCTYTINGQTGKIVGTLPADKNKAISFFAAASAVGALAIWLLLGFNIL